MRCELQWYAYENMPVKWNLGILKDIGTAPLVLYFIRRLSSSHRDMKYTGTAGRKKIAVSLVAIKTVLIIF